MKILILCTGNSCRSQMAHGFMESFDDRLDVYSAGTHPTGLLNEKAVMVMKQEGIDISHHTCESIDRYLGDEWDYVITLWGGANDNCPVFLGNTKNLTHIELDDPQELRGTDEYINSEFARIRDEIREGVYHLYSQQIKQQLQYAQKAES